MSNRFHVCLEFEACDSDSPVLILPDSLVFVYTTTQTSASARGLPHNSNSPLLSWLVHVDIIHHLRVSVFFYTDYIWLFDSCFFSNISDTSKFRTFLVNLQDNLLMLAIQKTDFHGFVLFRGLHGLKWGTPNKGKVVASHVDNKYGWWKKSPKQLRLVVYPIIFQGFAYPRCCRISSINNIIQWHYCNIIWTIYGWDVCPGVP